MNTDYEKIQTAPNNGIKFRTIAIFTLIAFIGGSVAAGWAITKYDLFQSNDIADNNGIMSNEPLNIDSKAITVAPAPQPTANNAVAVNQIRNNSTRQLDDSSMKQRVDSLDDRISRINVQAQQASGNANRTEAMLIAFAARRAIDSGSSLGYIADQLTFRFANTNQKDIDILIEASDNPIRLSALQNQIEQTSESLLSPNQDSNTWDTIKKEMSELFIIRKSGSPPPQPERRLERIKIALSSGDIKTAIAEMEYMPGAENTADWIASAKRYIRVQNALNAIERTAISIPSSTIEVPNITSSPQLGNNNEERNINNGQPSQEQPQTDRVSDSKPANNQNILENRSQ